MQVKPLADRVLIKPLEADEQKKGGIIIPDTAKEKPQEGEVVEVGPGRMTDEGKQVAMEVKKGDKVLYGKYSGTEVTVDDVDYLIMRESDILAVIG
jgi:chaperonin GroES